jgi:hypothetical protein
MGSILDRSHWGPKFWTLLHSLAEHSGNFSDSVRKNDEANYWVQLLKNQTTVMPCEVCKMHYSQYIFSVKFNELRELNGLERRTWLKKLLWNLHNNVNTYNQRPAFPYEQLEVVYGPITKVKHIMNDLIVMFQTATQKGKLKSEYIMQWKTCARYLITLYNM